MQRLNKSGFILTETLVVSVVLLISFIFVFTQFLNIFAQYQTFELYNNVDSLYVAKNIDSFLKEDNYNNVINALNSAGRPYYDFTNCSTLIFSFTDLCTALIQRADVSRALFTNYNITNLKDFHTYTNDFSHELKSYITYLVGKGFSEQPGIYRVILEMKDGTFATFAAINRESLFSKQQYRYKMGYITLSGAINSAITINKAMPATLTIEMWARASNMANKMLWSFANATSGPALYFDSNQNYIFHDGVSHSISGSSPLPALNTWNHYAVTFTGGATPTLFLYINGRYIGTTTYRSPSGSNLHIGRLNNSTGYNWRGDIKEIKIWNKALTPMEIINSMNNANITTTNMLYYYKLSEGIGTTMKDYSGNNHDIANALSNITWNVDPAFSSWIDGTVPQGMYSVIETRILYYYDGKWVTEEELKL